MTTITIPRRPIYGDPITFEADLSADAPIKAKVEAAVSQGANLRGANLYGADLTGASLYDADLRGADLAGAHLTGADLAGADLRGATISGNTLKALTARATRSDGYEFFAFRLSDDTLKVMAGCRWFTIAEFRDHVQSSYPDTPKAVETLDILEFLEKRGERS